MPRIVFLGDIVGKPGRSFVAARLPSLREELAADLVVANGENAAGGSGITGAIAGELQQAGVDAITLGDHVWDQRGWEVEIQELDYVCRPANLPPQCPGRTHLVVTTPGGFRLGVFTVLGRTFMNMKSDCPFAAADKLLRELAGQCDAVLAEVHAETTSEKQAFGWYFDGRASLIVGTHTHVPTADGRILPRGSAFQCDVGMCGPYESCLGRQIAPVLGRFLDGMPRRFLVAEGDVRLCGCIVDLDPADGHATRYERLEVHADAETDAAAPAHEEAGDTGEAAEPGEAASPPEAATGRNLPETGN